ncbi:MAG: hypothetical protein J7L19_03170 [Dehalococcoidia bacterium]|nr:hypothetical protein [Dehalococcoidia bacterium]
MRFLNPFKSNFTRIAETTTKFYLELTRKYNDRFDSEISLLATAGVLDAQWYVFARNPQISVSEIIQKARDIVSGDDFVAVTVRHMRLTKNLEKTRTNFGDFLTSFGDYVAEPDPLIDFVVSLEERIFEVESPRVGRTAIMGTCSKGMPTITTAIQKTKEKYTGERRISSDTARFMESPRFESFRKELGIRELGTALRNPNPSST